MSFRTAYTTSFRSLDNTLWEIEIQIDGYEGRPVVISLEGDEPCVIEWKETGKTDVVQSSTCTLRVSNESDRQMVQLMGIPDAAVLVSRNGKAYWFGYSDDAVYEEPYSYKKAYVTELTFTDFGTLNRRYFFLEGRQSVAAIVADCLDPIGYDGVANINLYTSLLEPKTQQPIPLDMLYINASRFAADDRMTTKREVLEDVLRPLGLRIIQKNGQIYIYDIEYLRDHDFMHNYPVWKGTDAYLSGSETFGRYDVSYDPDVVDTLAEQRYRLLNDQVSERYYAKYYDENAGESDPGFYIELIDRPASLLNPNGRLFRTKPNYTDSDDIGCAWRVRAHPNIPNPPLLPQALLLNPVITNIAAGTPIIPQEIPVAAALFKIETGYLPVSPDNDKYRLRVSLDLLLSPKLNPFEGDEEWNTRPSNTDVNYKYWKKLVQAYVPVKLELIDMQGNAIAHYRNLWRNNYTPLDPGEGQWLSGPADFGDMVLAYYNDGLDLTALEGWATNRQTMLLARKRQPSIYKRWGDGEYVTLPEGAGTLRLTVSNCIWFPDPNQNLVFSRFLNCIRWQMYRNAKIELVRNAVADNGIDHEAVVIGDYISSLRDELRENLKAGCWRKGIAPYSRGLLFDSVGNVWEQFMKAGSTLDLLEHRLISLKEQTAITQPVLTGTAELDIQFCAKRETNTPGVFLVTALRQDIHQDTEELTMVRISNAGGFAHYSFAWHNPLCAEQEQPYGYVWSRPVCIREPGPFEFAWCKAVCVKQYVYIPEWE